MKQYSSYKYSPIKWAGEIPQFWEIAEIAHFTTSKSGGTPDRNKKEYWENGTIPWMSSGEINKVEVFDTNEKITPLGLSCSSAKMLEPNTVMIALNGQGKTKGMSAILRIYSSCNQSLCGFMCDERCLNFKYLYYCFQSMYKYLRSQAGDDTREGLAASDIRKERIPVPSYKEQIAIVKYLEAQCTNIDKVIAAQEKRVELLRELKQTIITRAVTHGINPDVKLKDSVAKWIGQIPEHWEILKVKYIASLYGRIGFRGYNQSDIVLEGEGAITLSPSNMKEMMNYNSCTYLSWHKYYESPEIMIKDGDILFVKTGSTYGKSVLVDNLPMEATINPQIVVFKDFKCHNKFLSYVLKTPYIRAQVDNTVIGSTIPTISQEKIKNYCIALPPLSEQCEICEYIEKKTIKIDSSLSIALHQIDLLKEYKQSLITEVVTGKRKVF